MVRARTNPGEEIGCRCAADPVIDQKVKKQLEARLNRVSAGPTANLKYRWTKTPNGEPQIMIWKISRDEKGWFVTDVKRGSTARIPVAKGAPIEEVMERTEKLVEKWATGPMKEEALLPVRPHAPAVQPKAVEVEYRKLKEDAYEIIIPDTKWGSETWKDADGWHLYVGEIPGKKLDKSFGPLGSLDEVQKKIDELVNPKPRVKPEPVPLSEAPKEAPLPRPSDQLNYSDWKRGLPATEKWGDIVEDLEAGDLREIKGVVGLHDDEIQINRLLSDPEYRPRANLSQGTRDYLRNPQWLNDPLTEGRKLTQREEGLLQGILADAKPLASDRVVYRGLSWHDIKDMEIGEWKDLSRMTSTTMSPEIGGGFVHDFIPAMLQIQIRKGTKAILTNKGQAELIIPPGARVRLVKKHGKISVERTRGGFTNKYRVELYEAEIDLPTSAKFKARPKPALLVETPPKVVDDLLGEWKGEIEWKWIDEADRSYIPSKDVLIQQIGGEWHLYDESLKRLGSFKTLEEAKGIAQKTLYRPYRDLADDISAGKNRRVDDVGKGDHRIKKDPRHSQDPEYRSQASLSEGSRSYLGQSSLNLPLRQKTKLTLEQSKQLEEIIQDAKPLQADRTVFRGMELREGGVLGPAYDSRKYLKEGFSEVATSITSTSMEPGIASGFTPSGGILMQIKIKKGVRAIVTNQGQTEVLVPPGASLRVVKNHGKITKVDLHGNEARITLLEAEIDLPPLKRPKPALLVDDLPPKLEPGTSLEVLDQLSPDEKTILAVIEMVEDKSGSWLEKDIWNKMQELGLDIGRPQMEQIISGFSGARRIVRSVPDGLRTERGLLFPKGVKGSWVRDRGVLVIEFEKGSKISNVIVYRTDIGWKAGVRIEGRLFEKLGLSSELEAMDWVEKKIGTSLARDRLGPLSADTPVYVTRKDLDIDHTPGKPKIWTDLKEELAQGKRDTIELSPTVTSKTHIRDPEFRDAQSLSEGTQKYQKTSDWINKPLRRNKRLSLEERKLMDGLLRDMRPLESDRVMYRGMALTGDTKQYLEGEYVTKGFSSFSMDHGAAGYYAQLESAGRSGGTKMILQVRVPKGTPAIVTNPPSSEVILPPGMRLRIVSVRKKIKTIDHMSQDAGELTLVEAVIEARPVVKRPKPALLVDDQEIAGLKYQWSKTPDGDNQIMDWKITEDAKGWKITDVHSGSTARVPLPKGAPLEDVMKKTEEMVEGWATASMKKKALLPEPKPAPSRLKAWRNIDEEENVLIEVDFKLADERGKLPRHQADPDYVPREKLRQGTRDYAGTRASMELNEKIRERTPLTTDERKMVEDLIADAKPLQGGRITYRGIVFEDQAHLDEFAGGVSHGFTSTSMDPDWAAVFSTTDIFSKKKIRALLQIELQDGVKAIVTNAQEAEVILPPGFVFKRVGATKKIKLKGEWGDQKIETLLIRLRAEPAARFDLDKVIPKPVKYEGLGPKDGKYKWGETPEGEPTIINWKLVKGDGEYKIISLKTGGYGGHVTVKPGMTLDDVMLAVEKKIDGWAIAKTATGKAHLRVPPEPKPSPKVRPKPKPKIPPKTQPPEVEPVPESIKDLVLPLKPEVEPPTVVWRDPTKSKATSLQAIYPNRRSMARRHRADPEYRHISGLKGMGSYSGRGGISFSLNRALHEGKRLSPRQAKVLKDIVEEAQPLKANRTVFRSVEINKETGKLLDVGYETALKTPTSTSMDWEWANIWADNERIIMKMNLKRGVRATVSNPSEAEVLLMPGTRVRTVGIQIKRVDREKVHFVEVDVEPLTAPPPLPKRKPLPPKPDLAKAKKNPNLKYEWGASLEGDPQIMIWKISQDQDGWIVTDINKGSTARIPVAEGVSVERVMEEAERMVEDWASVGMKNKARLPVKPAPQAPSEVVPKLALVDDQPLELKLNWDGYKVRINDQNHGYAIKDAFGGKFSAGIRKDGVWSTRKGFPTLDEAKFWVEQQLIAPKLKVAPKPLPKVVPEPKPAVPKPVAPKAPVPDEPQPTIVKPEDRPKLTKEDLTQDPNYGWIYRYEGWKLINHKRRDRWDGKERIRHELTYIHEGGYKAKVTGKTLDEAIEKALEHIQTIVPAGSRPLGKITKELPKGGPKVRDGKIEWDDLTAYDEEVLTPAHVAEDLGEIHQKDPEFREKKYLPGMEGYVGWSAQDFTRAVRAGERLSDRDQELLTNLYRDARPLSNDRTVYRGMSLNDETAKLLQIGREEVLIAPTSTSMDWSWPTEFSGSGGLLLKMNVKEGVRGIVSNKVEAEVLLMPGTRVRVVKDHGWIVRRYEEDFQVREKRMRLIEVDVGAERRWEPENPRTSFIRASPLLLGVRFRNGRANRVRRGKPL